jgi:hypothetical protein
MKHEGIVRAGIVILVHFDIPIVRDVPSKTIDEKGLSQPKILVKRRAMTVLAKKVERDGVHDSLSKVESVAKPVRKRLLMPLVRSKSGGVPHRTEFRPKRS